MDPSLLTDGFEGRLWACICIDGLDAQRAKGPKDSAGILSLLLSMRFPP
jgi:hypothetical protein